MSAGGGGYGYASDGGYISERGYHSERGYGTMNPSYMMADPKEGAGYASEGDCLIRKHQHPSIDKDDDPSDIYSNRHVTKFARHTQRMTSRLKRRLVQGSYYITLDLDQYVDGPLSPFMVPAAWYFKVLWAFSVPAVCIFYITIPDCRKPKWRRWALHYSIIIILHLDT